MFLRALLVAAAAAVPSVVPAQADAPAELDPVVVTAARAPARASETLAAITVIGREEIERAQATDVAELLRFVAGVEVARAGGPGQFAAAFIRGGNSQHTLVLLDGARLNPTTQGAALQNLDPDLVERIEIVRGPRSTLYGSDAMGGVIHVITRRRDGPALDARVRHGSYETGDVSATGAFGTAQAGARLHAARLDSRGFVPHTDGTDERAYDNTTFDARGDWRVGALDLTAGAWDAQGRSEYAEDADPFCFPCVYDDPAALDFHNRALGAEARWQARERLETALALERTLDQNEIVEGAFAGSLTRNERTQARWQGAWHAAPGSRLALALEHARERTVAGGVTERRDVSGVSFTDELSLGRHRALLAGSVHDHDAFGTARLWNAEYGYELGTLRLSLGAGTGFRAPNVIERFFPGYGNPDLDPERARSYEAGVRRRFGGAHLELRAFRTDYEDLIQFDPGTFLAGNVGRARNEGLELTGRVPLGDAAWLRAGGVLQDPRACDPGCGSGAPLVRRARRSASLQLGTTLGRGEYALDLLAVGRRADFDSGDFSPATLPGYVLANLAAGAEVAPGWTLRARIENLLDADYQTVEGYRQPARAGTVTLQWALQ